MMIRIHASLPGYWSELVMDVPDAVFAMKSEVRAEFLFAQIGDARCRAFVWEPVDERI